MDQSKDPVTLFESSIPPETIRDELDRQLFHLKTLYDVSRELLGLVEVKGILKNFLMMTMGNFGVIEGFVLIQDTQSEEVTQLELIGFKKSERPMLLKGATRLLVKGQPGGPVMRDDALQRLEFLPHTVACVVAFCVDKGCSGFLGLGSKIVGDPYSEEDKDLLQTLVNNLVVCLKNARASEALKKAYEEVASLNRAKDKVINHLSHELKTPVASVMGCLTQLKRKLASVPEENWQRTMKRAVRNVERLFDIQYKVDDIMKDKGYRIHHMLSILLDQCADEIEVLIAEQIGDSPIIERIRNRIDELFGRKEIIPTDIELDEFVIEKLEEISPHFSHRQLSVTTSTEETETIHMAADPLEKLVKGLIKNAIENTPEEGKIEISVRNKGRSVEFVVKDTGVGISPEHHKRIFEGFYPIQETIAYRSGKPYDFNAGGKGADLLRMKIFSERFDFKLNMTSSRCRHIPLTSDVCPGSISKCDFCTKVEDCYNSGGTTFTAIFPFEPQPAGHKL